MVGGIQKCYQFRLPVRNDCFVEYSTNEYNCIHGLNIVVVCGVLCHLESRSMVDRVPKILTFGINLISIEVELTSKSLGSTAQTTYQVTVTVK